MLYKITCQHCGQRVSFEENAAGMSVACPHCQQALQLTVPATAEPQPSAPASSPTHITSQSAFRRLLPVAAGVIVLGVIAAGAFFFLKRGPGVAQKEATDPNAYLYAAGQELTVNPPSEDAPNPVIASNAEYTVTFRKNLQLATVYFCDVTFAQSKPAPADVDRIVRESLEKCVKVDSSLQIISMAFLSNQPLQKTEYSGPLLWKPEEKTIQPVRGTELAIKK